MIMTITLYHNPRCSKSRAALAILRDRGITPRVIEYLKHPLDERQLRYLTSILVDPPIALIRRKDAIKQGLNPDMNEDDIIPALIRHPCVMERPIVMTDHQAWIARPPELLLAPERLLAPELLLAPERLLDPEGLFNVLPSPSSSPLS